MSAHIHGADEDPSNVCKDSQSTEAAMTYAAHHKDFAPYVDDGALPRSGAVTKKTGLLRRIIDAIHQSPQRQADREFGWTPHR
jgi:hypothetical protein